MTGVLPKRAAQWLRASASVQNTDPGSVRIPPEAPFDPNSHPSFEACRRTPWSFSGHSVMSDTDAGSKALNLGKCSSIILSLDQPGETINQRCHGGRRIDDPTIPDQGATPFLTAHSLPASSRRVSDRPVDRTQRSRAWNNVLALPKARVTNSSSQRSRVGSKIRRSAHATFNPSSRTLAFAPRLRHSPARRRTNGE